MDAEVIAVIGAVKYAEAAERHVAHHDVKHPVGERRILEALDLHIDIGI